MTKNIDAFKGKHLIFEMPTDVDDLGMRYFDVVVDADESFKRIFYEFKSVAKVPPGKFAQQFIKDLANAENLDQIRWIFDGRKNPENFVANITEAIKALPNDKLSGIASKFGFEDNIGAFKDHLLKIQGDIFILMKM